MSTQAVQDFFATISQTPKAYRALTEGDAQKVRMLALLMGYDFTEEDLEYARLTNIRTKHPMFSTRIDDEFDLSPTPLPHPPSDPQVFREKHGRDVCTTLQAVAA